MSYSVVIPSRNVGNLTACVGALRAAGETCRVIAIWDGKGPVPLPVDEIVDWWAVGWQPFVFARNANIGIRAVYPDDVVILNDDAILKTTRGLARLAQDAAEHPEYGVIAASCDACGTPEQVHCDARLVPDGEHYAVEPSLHAAPLMVAFICVYIPRRVLNLVGLLDERFCVNAGGEGPRGYGCEDDDYCWRVRQAGLKLGVENSVVVNHTKLKSTFRADPAHPADVRLHEKVFKDKWGVSPRTGKPSWWAEALELKENAEIREQWAEALELKENAEIHKQWAEALEEWRDKQAERK